MLLGLSVLAGCQATEGPRPVPVADNVEGIKFKEISPTKWSVWVQLDDSKLQPQKDPEFCWAASVRAIKLHTQGNAPTQEKLYEQHIWTMPAEKRKAGYKHEIIDAMAGGFRDDFNQRYVIDLKDHASLSEKDIVLSLSAGQPVLVGFGSSKVSEQGHVCVIYGVQYEEVEV